MTCYSDDGEPITREWMLDTYGDVRIQLGLFTVWFHGNVMAIDVVCDACDGRVSRRVPGNTRGDLRRLLAALGYRREG